VIRNLLPLAMMAFLCAFSLMAFQLSWPRQATDVAMFRETTEAIEKIRPGTASLDARHPLQLTVEDLSRLLPSRNVRSAGRATPAPKFSPRACGPPLVYS